MREEIKKWWKLAEEDYDTAKYNFKGGKYKVSVFLCQQSIEKSFKAVLLKKTGEIRRIHDLVALGRDINAPENIINSVKEVTLAYIYTRYPDVREESNIKEKASKFLIIVREVLQWTKKNL